MESIEIEVLARVYDFSRKLDESDPGKRRPISWESQGIDVFFLSAQVS